MRRFAWLPLLAVLGCGKSAPPPARPPIPAPIEPWAAVCVDALAAEPAFIGNGLIGVRIGRDGSGKELPAFRIDGYQPDGEEKILKQPNPAAISWTFKGKDLAPDPEKPYRQELDLRTGGLSTQFGTEGVDVAVTARIDPDLPVFTQEWTLRVSSPGKVLWSAQPMGDVPVEASLLLDGKAISGASIEVTKGQTVTLRRKVTYPIATDTPPATAAPDIEIEGPVEDQQAVRAFLTYLKMSVPNARKGGPEARPLQPVSPNALSSNQYNGHVFWDADLWVFPAMAMLYPERAKAIPDYRLATLGPAIKNFDEFWARRMTYQTDHGVRQTGAAKYGWESSITGAETAHGPFLDEDHINGDVLWGLTMAEQLGLASPPQVSGAAAALDAFWQSMITPRTGPRAYGKRKAEDSAAKATGLYDVGFVFGADEYRTIDNDLFTNVLAQWTLNGRTHIRPPKTPELFLAKDQDGVFATFEGDEQPVFKQASAVLSIYPLQFPPAEAQAAKMIAKYGHRIAKSGPAMAGAIHSIIYARLGDVDKAYEEWQGAWKPFSRPLMLFSETRRRDRSYFSTGAGGCLQSVLYGFLGIRIDSKPEPGAQWSKRLNRGWLSIKPHLPKQWKRVTVQNLSILGQNYKLTVTHNGLQMEPTVSKPSDRP